jgi:photosystem I subunit 3
MAKLFTILLAALLMWATPQVAKAEGLTSLEVCSDVPAFVQRGQDRVAALEAKVAAAEAGSQQAKVAQQQLANTKARFDKYGSLLCGTEGLPHLVTDGRLNHAGEFLIPGLMFLYIAGFIGWAGRSYLIKVREGDNAAEKEATIDIGLALACVSAAVAWPALALTEISTGKLTVPDDAVPISPR